MPFAGHVTLLTAWCVFRIGQRPSWTDGFHREVLLGVHASYISPRPSLRLTMFLQGPAKLIEHSDLFKAGWGITIGH